MGGLQNRDTAAKLSGAAPQLMRQLRKEYRNAAGAAAGKAKRSILAASSKHPGSLREEIAATVTVAIRAGGKDGFLADISSYGTRMPPGKEALPAYADAETPRYTRWRHPVFGRIHDPWKTQEWPSARGWFTGTLMGEKNRFAAAMQKAVDDIKARLR